MMKKTITAMITSVNFPPENSLRLHECQIQTATCLLMEIMELCNL